MADLDFKHHVGQIPAGAPLPEPEKRHVGAEIAHVPDFQSALTNYAANTNWLSTIGSAVASFASNELAAQLGTNLGRNPQGSLSTPITDFDKTFAQSYNTQAQATLGLQANKLITDSNLEVAKASRITPDLIEKTNQQVSAGLNNIFKNAPRDIRPNLEYQYGIQQYHQTATLTEKMIHQQREDRKANTAVSSQNYAESAHSLAMAGDYKGALASVDATKKLNDADVAAGLSTPLVAKTNTEAAKKSYLIGKYSHEFDMARAEGKSEAYLRGLAEHKPSDISDSQYQTVLSGVMQHVNQQLNLLKQDQTLAMTSFKVKVAENPMSITGGDLATLKEHLDPNQFQEASLYYVQQVKKFQAKKNGANDAQNVYTDINLFPLQSAENKNAAWEKTYKAMLQQPENKNMSIDSAKIMAAAAAPVAIPAYITELNAKLSTADPNNLETAGQALNYFNSHNLNQNVIGVGEQQVAMSAVYTKLREFMNPVEAAQVAHNTIYNKSKEQKDANTASLQDYYSRQKKKNETPFSMTRRMIETPSDVMIRNLPGYTQKANNLFEIFWALTNGDEVTTTKLTKQAMDSAYGKSRVNGDNELMYHPIENIPGIPSDATGAIQTDIVQQANTRFAEDRKLYEQGKTDYWFEARQKISHDEAMTSKRILDAISSDYGKHPISGLVFDIHSKRAEYKKHREILEKYNTQSITIIKHNRSGKEEVYDGAIQANPWAVNTGNPSEPISGGWDVMIKTEKGMRNIPLMNPLNSNVQYKPRVDFIKNLYVATHGLTILENYYESHFGTAAPNTLARQLYDNNKRENAKK